MDNNEIDKILKEKLKNQITPSKEFEQKMQNTIKEQKGKVKKETKSSKLGKMKLLISIAAVAIIAFMLGISFNENGINFEEKTVTIAKITDIKPTKSSNEILAKDSGFLIYAEGENLTTESVQKALYIEPALEYKIEKTNNANEYKLTFEQNIPDNTIVKLQYVKDLITEDSWAYQTANELSISGTYPSDGSNYVSNNSVVEIEFSYATVENLQDYVDITPAVNGTWEHLGKVWRFTPAKQLNDGKYYIKVKSGIIAEQKTLKEDYMFEFEVGEYVEQQYRYNSISIDNINTYKPTEPVRIYCQGAYYGEKLEISKLEIAKFTNKEDFIEYLQNKNYSKATNLGKYEFEQTTQYVQLNKTLQSGYYVAIIYRANNSELFNCPIQINELSAYAIATERDVTVWVANGENLAKDVDVEYKGKIVKTNNQGLAEFKEIADDSETIKYIGIGNTSNKLVVGVYNYDLDNYPSAYLYSDRPLYKNTDTINIWGYVPENLFYDKVEEEFYIELNSEGKQKVKVENGSLNYKINLKNHIDSENATIKLYYKEKEIAYRQVTIENYEAQNYTYEVIYNKNYAYAGTKFEFDVKVNHITGLAVPNKNVRANIDGKTYRVASEEKGIAHFSIDIPTSNNLYTSPNYREITIFNGDTEEYTGKEQHLDIYVLNRDVHTVIEEKEKTYTATIYKIADDRNVKTDYNLENLHGELYNTSVNIKLKETVSTRQISGYKYDEYTKQNEPQYTYTSSYNTQEIKNVNTQNGVVQVNLSELQIKKATEENNYNYELIFTYKDQAGRTVEDTNYLYLPDSDNSNNNYGFYYERTDWEDRGGSDDMLWKFGANIDSFSYYTYRYFLKNEVKPLSIGETTSFTLCESTKEGNKEIKNEGKILRLVLQENITKKEIIENNKFDYTFKEIDFPGCKITTAYFYKGNFYRMPIYYFDFKEEDRKVNIEITADKEEYKPGEEVTLTVRTTNNEKPVQSFVNISVVNEAVFALVEDTTDLIETIYQDKDYPIYTYSSYRDYIEPTYGGGGGGGENVRHNFADTAHFETVYTDSKGTATITFKLPDNVTTYRVTAHSANEDLYLGVNTIDIVSKLDFFIQITEPRNIKTTDDLVLNATSIAEEKYDVEYEFTIKELNKTLTTTGSTNTMATVNFGKLPYGTYTVRTTGKYGEVQDIVEYQVEIIESAQEIKTKITVDIQNGAKIEPTKNPIVLEIYNKNMKQYIDYIDFVEKTLTTRLDTQIAYNQVQQIKDRYYNTESANNAINISNYQGNYLKNLPNGEEDILLSALISYYTDGYFERDTNIFTNTGNIFESYLLASANNKPVLVDLIHLKEEQNISNYNKLLVTLSLEFLGDFENARELYNTIILNAEEAEEYKSLVAIIETFISKESAVTKINELISNKPADEYLRFAILSFFENNSADIEKESEVKITSTNLAETIKLNGMQVKTLTINNTDLNSIKFETQSKDLMVSYYYQTSLDNIEAENISKDMNIKINGELKKGNTVTLVVEFTNQFEGPVRIALPNSLRLAENYSFKANQKYWLQNNQIDYVTYFKQKECTKMEIPLMITYEGNYKFENIVCNTDGTYHISNSLELNINK